MTRAGWALRRSSAAKQGVQEAFPSRAQMAKTAASEAAAAKKAAAKPAKAAKTKSGDGQSAADIWAAQLDDKQRQPRGYR